MTRFLSQALEAPEPSFRMGLKQLEAASGHPAADIRISNEIRHLIRSKTAQLGLDPHDTTPVELYRALEQRLSRDEVKLTRFLRTQAATHISAEADAVAGITHVLKELPDSKRCFALKPSVLKALLRKLPPKKAMRALGYRSQESFIKHEQPVLILTAAWLVEGEAWRKRLLDQYKKLEARDFESRSIMILHPASEKWRRLSARLVDEHRHNLISFKELGALIFLPLPAHAPEGAVVASLSLGLHELNEIRSATTFLQMRQMRPDFGEAVVSVALTEPQLSSGVLDQPMPWNLVQRYYSQFKQQFDHELLEPYLRAEEMSWHAVEHALAKIEPSFEFWRGSAHLALMDGHKPVSFNLLDVALNFCNKLSYEERSVHYFQKSLWQELLLRYLKPHKVEAVISAEMQPQLATETVTA